MLSAAVVTVTVPVTTLLLHVALPISLGVIGYVPTLLEALALVLKTTGLDKLLALSTSTNPQQNAGNAANVAPYTLLLSSTVMLRAAVVTVNVPATKLML